MSKRKFKVICKFSDKILDNYLFKRPYILPVGYFDKFNNYHDNKEEVERVCHKLMDNELVDIEVYQYKPFEGEPNIYSNCEIYEIGHFVDNDKDKTVTAMIWFFPEDIVQEKFECMFICPYSLMMDMEEGG